MPIYEYRCDDCGHRLDALQKLADDPLRDCPACSASALRRLVSAPNFRLKGQGWYETDFKSDKETRRNLVDRPEESTGEKEAGESGKGEGTTRKGDGETGRGDGETGRGEGETGRGGGETGRGGGSTGKGGGSAMEKSSSKTGTRSDSKSRLGSSSSKSDSAAA